MTNFGSKSGWDIEQAMGGPCLERDFLSIFPSENPEMCKEKFLYLPYTINRVKAFDYRRDFTIAAWVKMESKAQGNGPIVGTYPYHRAKFQLYRKFNNKKVKLTQLKLITAYNRGEQARTTFIDKDFDKWNHVAVVLKLPNIVKFYLNGEEWLLQNMLKPNFNVLEPDEFRFNENGRTWVGFVAMVQRPLSGKEINKLMKTLVL